MDSNPYYINPDGNIVQYENMFSHIGIAMRILEENSKLKEEFESSKIKYPTDFLVENKGFIQVTNDEGNGYYEKKLLFSASKMSKVQKQLIMRFIAEGYTYENIDVTKKNNVIKFHDFDF